MRFAPDRHSQRLLPLADKPPGSLLIHEIYKSIQGESTFAGLPCVFVRLAVCHARCRWCDTPYAFSEGNHLSLESVLEKVAGFECPVVEITGGEPLLQEEVYELMKRLADGDKTVLLETSGLQPIDRVDPRVHIILDLKCPESGECENNCWNNLDVLKPSDQIKFVVASRLDFDWAAEVIRKYTLDRRFTVLFSPVFGEVEPRELAKWIIDCGLNVRLQLQMHKYVWDPKARGV